MNGLEHSVTLVDVADDDPGAERIEHFAVSNGPVSHLPQDGGIRFDAPRTAGVESQGIADGRKPPNAACQRAPLSPREPPKMELTAIARPHEKRVLTYAHRLEPVDGGLR
jgi:hypothetical protein